jgi:lipopolysaccharide transport protein LptA
MNRRNSIIFGLLFIILVVELIILLPKDIGSLAESESLVIPPATGPAEKYRQQMDNVYSVEAKPEGKEWELWADNGFQLKENTEWTIQNVRVKFYASNGVLYVVTGKEGRVAPNEKGVRDIRITGNVVTKSSNGHVFKSQDVLYNSQDKTLKSPGEIEMVSPPNKDGGEMFLTGADMNAVFSTNEITVGRNVKGKKRIKNNKVVQIQSERATFSGRTKMAQFYGSVTMTMDTMTVTGPEAKFVYDAKGEALESLDVGGGVKVSDLDKFATSQSVNLNLKNDKVVFKGAPRVVQNGDEMTGDVITFLNGGKQVVVSNAKARIDSSTLSSPEPEKSR